MLITKNNTFSRQNPIMGLIILLFISSSISSCEQSPFKDGIPPCERTVELSSFEMVWNDEFEGSDIDLNKWSFQIGDGCDISENLCGWGNNEKQWYTDRPENAKVENGNLIITAQKEAQPFNDYDYTSARMRTLAKGDWKFGRIDVRAKMPLGQGLWAAIWMLSSENKYGGWPRSGEIDIMEYLGNKPFETFSTIHYGHDFWRFTSQPFLSEGINFTEDFHVFSVIWEENCMRFMVDGKLFGNPYTPSTTLPTTYPFNEKFHLILNLAVGGNLPGEPTPSTVFPQTMEVDYVRVYQRN